MKAIGRKTKPASDQIERKKGEERREEGEERRGRYEKRKEQGRREGVEGNERERESKLFYLALSVLVR